MSIGMRTAVMLMFVMAAGCSGEPDAPTDTGEQFVGTWVATTDSSAVMHIERHQEAFILRFDGNAQGHGFGHGNATGAYEDGVLEVRRGGIQFTFALNVDSGELSTGFKPATFRRRIEGEAPPTTPPPQLPKL